jgi:branched-chain amino acid transport system substrate-binding protein
MKKTKKRKIWHKTLFGAATSVALASAGVMGVATSAYAQDRIEQLTNGGGNCTI